MLSGEIQQHSAAGFSMDELTDFKCKIASFKVTNISAEFTAAQLGDVTV